MSSPFSMKVPPPNQGSETPPAGNHQAVLVALIDLGTHREAFQGGPSKDVRKVFLAWEMVQEKLAGLDRGHVVGKQFTLSYHTKASLRQLIKGWRGKDLADGEEFDLAKLVGKPCFINITHTAKNDSVYAVLGNVSQVPKGTVVPKPSVELVTWFIGCDKPFPAETWLPWSYGEELKDVLNRSHEICPPPTATVNGAAALATAAATPDSDFF